MLSVLCRPLRRVLFHALCRGLIFWRNLVFFLPQLLDLRSRYRLLTNSGTHLAGSLFMDDRLAPSRTMSTTPVAVECENVVRAMGDNPVSVDVWWHDQWKLSERVGDLHSLLHQSWLDPAQAGAFYETIW